jgi:hypothetical protein
VERRILALGRALRETGAPVSTPEILDAAQAALAVGVERRGDLRSALRASLAKRTEDLPAFDEHFERLFPAGIDRPQRRRGGRGARGAVPGSGDGAGAGGDTRAAQARGGGASSGEGGRELRDGEDRETGDGNRREDGGPEAEGSPAGETGADAAANAAAAASSGSGDIAAGAAGTGQREPPSRAATRRRLLAKGFRERWSADEERQAAGAMEELASRLVTRPALRRRRSRRGALDMTGTLRANLVHGGIPFVLRRRARSEGRRDLVLLADVSGSVRRAAALFLLILGRLRGRFGGVRAFAYVDRPAEIPASLAARPPAEIAAALASALPLDALSDHGEMLRRFNRDFPGAVGGRTVVVVLGDARNNRFPAQEWELEAIRRRCRRLLWIVPEPPSLWGSGDSAIGAYAPLCDRVLAAPTPLALAAAAADLAGGGVLRAARHRTR